MDAVLVGKGVTYDAGGINLKDRKNLTNMYADMAGAAAVAATMKSIALERRMVNVAAVVGLIETCLPVERCIRLTLSGQCRDNGRSDEYGRRRAPVAGRSALVCAKAF